MSYQPINGHINSTNHLNNKFKTMRKYLLGITFLLFIQGCATTKIDPFSGNKICGEEDTFLYSSYPIGHGDLFSIKPLSNGISEINIMYLGFFHQRRESHKLVKIRVGNEKENIEIENTSLGSIPATIDSKPYFDFISKFDPEESITLRTVFNGRESTDYTRKSKVFYNSLIKSRNGCKN